MDNGNDRLMLWKGRDCWLVRFLGGHRTKVVEAFGTDTIPTAFTAQAAGERVAAEIRRMNPGVEVRLVEAVAAVELRARESVSRSIGRDVLASAPCSRCGSLRHVRCGSVVELVEEYPSNE